MPEAFLKQGLMAFYDAVNLDACTEKVRTALLRFQEGGTP